MITKIMGEAPFQVLTNNFSISPSNEGYTLQISADGKNYSNLFQVGANVTRLVTGVAANSYYRLLGNDSEVSINWMKTCVTEGGTGGSGTELQPITEFPMDPADGTVVAYNGSASASGVYQFDGTDWVPVGVDDLSAYYTSAQTEEAITSKNYVTSAQVETQVEAYNYITSADAETQILEKNYITSAYVQDQLSAYTPTADFATINGSAITSGGNITIEGVSQDDFNFISGRVQTNEEVVSEALNNLNDRIEEISGSTPTIDLSAYTPTSGFATINGSAITNGGNLVIEGGGGGSTEDIELPIAAAINEVKDTFNAKLSQQYYKKQEVNDIAARKMEAGQVNEQIVSYVDPLIEEVNDTIEDKELPVSAAINELNEKKVEGINVKAIWSGSQADYDAIVTKDPDTLYIIK